MSNLNAALNWASRGFPVFKLLPGGKRPLPGSKGHLDATTDPEVIRAWWSERDLVSESPIPWNIGVNPPVGIQIVDLDEKHGHEGIKHWRELGGEVDGLIVRTPTGGLHVYHYGPDLKSTIGELGEGIDTRGADGYAIAPGSCVDGKYYELVSDGPMLTAPEFMAQRIKPRGYRPEAKPGFDVEPDREHNVARAIEIAKQFEPAETGLWHAIGFRLGAQLCRCGISQEKAVEVAYEHWAKRGTGFKDYDRFVSDICGGFSDADRKGEHGTESIDAARASFAGLKVTLPPDTEQHAEVGAPVELPRLILPSRSWAEGRILREQPVPYLIKHLVGPGDKMAVLGGPGSGKSVLLPDMAFAVATGRSFLGRKVKQGRVLYFAAENGLGLERRLQALGDVHGDPGDEWLRVFWQSLNLSASANSQLEVFVETIDTWQPALVIIDTMFSAFPGTDLTDRKAEGFDHVIEITKGVTEKIASHPVLAFGHHTPKSSETAYGGQQLQAMFDTTLFVEGELKEDRTVTIRKNRLGPDGDRYSFGIKSVELGFDDDGETITAPLIEWKTPEGAEAKRLADEERWLSDTNSDARPVYNILARLTEEALEAGRGSTPAEMLSGGPRARIPRPELASRLVTYGLIQEPVTDVVRDRLTDGWVKELKKRNFVDYDAAEVWLLPRR